jgi:hypothetical protein
MHGGLTPTVYFTANQHIGNALIAAWLTTPLIVTDGKPNWIACDSE